ncbi:MAG: Do family serine endopeptidase, partial [bacterium]
MKKKVLFVTFVLLLCFLTGAVSYHFFLGKNLFRIKGAAPLPINFGTSIGDTNRDFSQIVASVSPSVVNIAAMKKSFRDRSSYFNDDLFDFFDEGMPNRRKQQSLGSGVIIAEDGYIITNYHVIEGANEIKVTLFDKTSYTGGIVGIDQKTDLAVVKIQARSLPAAQWSTSDRLQVGEFVLAIGNPYGLSHTVTMGIISAVGRANVGIADYEDFIQTDAAINPGNSGGPLVNIRGELIGINTAIFSRSGGYQGIGFAVPSNMAKSVFEQLAKNGRVVRGWIGVTLQDLTAELAEGFGLKNTNGALISDVLRGSPAERAGLKRGDIVLSVDKKEIQNVSALRNMVAQSRIGSESEVGIVRNKSSKRFRVSIAELPKEYSEISLETIHEQARKEVLEGVTVVQLNREFARQLGLDADEKGVVIDRVEQGSPADDAGLKRGDVIQEINGRTIQSLKDFNLSAASIKEST